MKTLFSHTYISEQNVYHTCVVRIEILPVNLRVSIRKNAYVFQSSGEVEVWMDQHGAMGWCEVARLPGEFLKTKACYVQREVPVAAQFEDDVNELVRLARLVLS